MKIIVFPHILAKSFVALTIYPFILVKETSCKDNFVLINHEKIHLKQQIELLWIIFFIWFGVEYIIRLIKYKNSYLAYKNISFEREAYANEHNLDYLKTRKFYSFFKYL